MRKLAMLLKSLALATVLMATNQVYASAPVSAVPALDLSRYAGQWYEIARLPLSFQRNCASEVTATYSLRSDGTISVRNACRTEDGALKSVQGTARGVPGQAGQLQVRFAPDWLSWVPMVWADYWVLALDPGYQWALVGEPGRKYLWILSREPSMEREQFEQLSAQAQAMGYDLAPLIMSAPLRESATTP